MVSEETSIKSMTMISSNNISQLKVDGNVAEKWRIWKQKFEIYMEANDLLKHSQQRQVAIFLNLIGDDCLEIYNSFGIERSKLDLQKLIQLFDNKFNPFKNVTVERYNFFTRMQNTDETIDEYITTLTNLSNSCEFSTLKESLIKDMFVIGIKDSKIKEKLLQEDIWI